MMLEVVGQRLAGALWGHLEAQCLLLVGWRGRDNQDDDTRKEKEYRREQLAQMRPLKVRPLSFFRDQVM